VKKVVFLFLAISISLLIITSSVLAYADSTHRGEMFPNTVVLGVDISGMEKEAAKQVVQEEAVAPLMQPVTLVFKDKSWTINPAELGLEVDVNAMVEQAYSTGWNRSVFERAWRRTFNQPLSIEIGLAYSMDQEALRGKLQTIAKEVAQEPKSASLSFDSSSGKLTYSHSREGHKVDVDASIAVMEQAMLSPDQKAPELAVAITQPDLSDDQVQSVLVVDIMSNSLKYYNKDTLVNTYNVATGAPKYPTPLGKFYITRKEHDPVWVNPGSEWAKDMPPTIPAGPSSPLGVRALATSAAGGTVLIHGHDPLVPGLYSHGCIRMANWAVSELYENVEVGTPLFIWTSKPVPPPPDETPADVPEDPTLGQ
jgi:lipoprotein-anchoring transpeptidase ErfK/SrfK